MVLAITNIAEMAFSIEKVTRALENPRHQIHHRLARILRRLEPMRPPGPRVKKVELTSFELMSCVKAA